MGMGNGSRDDLNAKTPAEQVIDYDALMWFVLTYPKLDYWIKQLETLRKIEAGAEHMLDQQGNNVPVRSLCISSALFVNLHIAYASGRDSTGVEQYSKANR
jgi:hypothetical protein